MRKYFPLLLVLLLATISLVPAIKVEAEEESQWILIERGLDFERYQNSTNQIQYMWISASQWILNKSNGEYIPFIYEETADYYQVQSGLIGARIFKAGYAEFWDPNMTEVRLYEETWELQYWSGNKWSVCDTYSPEYTVESNEATVNITASYITDWPNSGERAFQVKYIFREGQPLKHEVEFTSYAPDQHEFRVLQKWAGIVASKVRYNKGEETVTSATTIDAHAFRFLKDDDSLSIFENQQNMYHDFDPITGLPRLLENHNLKPVVIDTHPKGLKADFVFGDWILAQDESLTVDPATATLYPLDDSSVDYTAPGNNYDASGFLAACSSSTPGAPVRYNFYLKFDLSSLSGATITSAKFRLYNYANSGSLPMYIKKVADDSWTEETLTWNNKKAVGATIFTGACGEGTGWKEHASAAIATYVDEEKGGLLSAWYGATGTNYAGHYNFYRDKEYSGGSLKPSLIVVYSSVVPPTVTTLSATLVEETTANPRGQVTATGGENPTRYIQYGTSTGFYVEGTYIDVWEAVTANGAPYTITTDGSNIWLLDYTVEAVYKYTMAGVYVGFWNLRTTNTDPNGIATDGNYIYVTDSGDAGVFKYNMAGVYVGFWRTRENYNEDPVGITTDGTYIWIIEGSIDVPSTLQRIYKYTMAGGYLGVWSPTAANDDPWGITTDGNYIWITDYTDDAVYKYTMAGGYLGTWSPTAANDDPWGITTDGNYIWIANTDNDAVYRYVYLAPLEKNCGVGGTGIYNSDLTGLTPGEKYYYRAKAVNTGGTGYGSEMTFITKPESPSSLNAYSPTDSQISLSWTKGTGAYYTYVIRKVGSYPANIGDGVQVYANTGSGTTDSSLSPGVHYFYRAWSRAYDGEWGSYSDGYSSDAEYTKPGNPSGLSATAVGSTQIDLAWTKGTGGDKTHIRRKIGSYPTSIFDGDQAYFDTGVSKEDTGLEAGNDYYYRGWAYDTDSGYYSSGYTEDWDTTPDYQNYKREVSQSLSVSGVIDDWLESWAHRLKMTIDHNDINAALTDFPILIYISTSSGRDNEDVSFVFDELGSDANRKKIAVTTSDGTTQCYVEIENWDHTGEQAWLWANIPSVSSSVDTDLYLYYDSTHADNTAYVGDPNSAVAENVWDSSFKLVTHMRDDPSTSNIRDSSQYDNDGVKKGAGEPALNISGKIGDAQEFDGSDDFVNLGTTLLNNPDVGTVSIWILPTADGESSETKPYWGTTILNKGLVYEAIQQRADNKIRIYFYDGAAWSWLDSSSSVTVDEWTYITYAWNATGSTIYFDGTPDVSSGTKTWADYHAGHENQQLDLGGMTVESLQYYFTGLTEELQISTIYRSPEWIKASYETGRDDLSGFGSEENRGGPKAIRILSAIRVPTQGITTTLNSLRSWQLLRIGEQSISHVFEGNRNFNALRSPTQELTLSSDALRQVDAGRNPVQSLTLASSTSRLWQLLKTAQQTLSVTPTAGREWALMRVFTQGISTTFNGNRILTALRGLSQTISTGFNAERLLTAIRNPAQGLSMTSGIGRTWSTTRVVTQSITSAFNAERLWILMRAVSQGMSLSLNGNRVLTAVRELSQTITATFNAEMVLAAVRTLAQSLGMTSSIGRTWSTTRVLTQAITSTFNTERLWTLMRTFTQDVSLTFNGDRILTALRGLSQGISASFKGERMVALIRMASQGMTTSFGTGRLWSTTRTVVQTVSTAFNTGRLWSTLRSVSQGISTVFNGERMLTALRGLTQGLSLTFNGERVVSLIRSASQSISTSYETLRSWALLKTVSQTISLSSDTGRYWSTFRLLTQTISTAFNGNRIWSMMREVTQGMSLIFDADRVLMAIRTASQTIAATFDIERIWSTSRTITQGITAVFNADRLWSLSRTMSQSISMILSTEKTGVFIRMASQSMSFVSNTFTHLYEFLAENMTLTITIVFDAFREWSLLRTVAQSLAANFNSGRSWAALRLLTQSISTAFNVERLWSLSRTVSQSISLVSSAFGKKFIHYIERTVSLMVGTSFDAFREWSLLRTGALSLTANFNAERLWTLLRTLTQTVGASFDTGRLWTTLRVASQSITAGFNADRGWTLLRTFTQSLTASFSAGRWWTHVRTLTQTISTSFNAGRFWMAFRDMSQTISTSLSVERIVSFTRELAQGLNLGFNALIDLPAFVRQVSLNINMATQAIRSWSLSRTFTQGLSFISGVSTIIGEMKMRLVSLNIQVTIALTMFITVINEFSVTTVMLSLITLLSTFQFLMKGRNTAWGAISTVLWFITGLSTIQSNPGDWIAVRVYSMFGTIMIVLTLISAAKSLNPDDPYFDDWE